MTDILFKCPNCSKHLVVDGVAPGRMVKCSDCGKPIQVPPADATFKCPSCGWDLSAPGSVAGEEFHCPNCETNMFVPNPSKVLIWDASGGASKEATKPTEPLLSLNGSSSTPSDSEVDPSRTARYCPGCVHPISKTAEVCPICGYDLLAGKPKLGRRCPKCDKAVAKDAVICIECGTDLRTGKHVQPIQTQTTQQFREAEEALTRLRSTEPELVAMGTEVSAGKGCLSIVLTIAGCVLLGYFKMCDWHRETVAEATTVEQQRQIAGAAKVEQQKQDTENAKAGDLTAQIENMTFVDKHPELPVIETEFAGLKLGESLQAIARRCRLKGIELKRKYEGTYSFCGCLASSGETRSTTVELFDNRVYKISIEFHPSDSAALDALIRDKYGGGKCIVQGQAVTVTVSDEHEAMSAAPAELTGDERTAYHLVTHNYRYFRLLHYEYDALLGKYCQQLRQEQEDTAKRTIEDEQRRAEDSKNRINANY